jgi:hypothetical protein
MSTAPHVAAGERWTICALGHVHWGAMLLADVKEMFEAYSMLETDATGWFTTREMHTLPLHPGVRRGLDELER